MSYFSSYIFAIKTSIIISAHLMSSQLMSTIYLRHHIPSYLISINIFSPSNQSMLIRLRALSIRYRKSRINALFFTPGGLNFTPPPAVPLALRAGRQRMPPSKGAWKEPVQIRPPSGQGNDDPFTRPSPRGEDSGGGEEGRREGRGTE
jgi:hypothetical protein